MKRLTVIASVLVAAALAGCGSSSSSSSSSTASASSTASSSSTATASAAAAPAATGGTLTLNESEFKIDPATAHVAGSGAITLTVKNTGAVTHALTVQTPAGPVSTSNIAPGQTATLKVNIAKPGRYTFFCPIPGHEAAGMKGTLVVG